jgi:hypothetical protein
MKRGARGHENQAVPGGAFGETGVDAIGWDEPFVQIRLPGWMKQVVLSHQSSASPASPLTLESSDKDFRRLFEQEAPILLLCTQMSS